MAYLIGKSACMHAQFVVSSSVVAFNTPVAVHIYLRGGDKLQYQQSFYKSVLCFPSVEL